MSPPKTEQYDNAHKDTPTIKGYGYPQVLQVQVVLHWALSLPGIQK